MRKQNAHSYQERIGKDCSNSSFREHAFFENGL